MISLLKPTPDSDITPALIKSILADVSQTMRSETPDSLG
jgi:hypothetical protein